MRGKIKLGIGLGLVALTASVALPAIASTAGATTTAPALWNYIWKPGTALPNIGPGETLSAWPVQSVLAHVKVGHTVPTVVIGHTTSTGKYVQTATAKQITAVTDNATGLVNVQAAPQRCEKPEKKKDLGLRWTAVATTFSRVGPVTQSVHYGQGQSSSLAIGYSVSGKVGSFHFDGTASASSDSQQDFPTFKRGRERYLSEFVYGKYFIPCGITQTSYWEVRVTEWAGGDKVKHKEPIPTARYCVIETNPGIKPLTFTKGKTTAVNFAAGFSVYGFTGSAQTGYDSNLSVSFTDPPGTDYHLCGTHDYPGGNHVPKILVANH